jgi:hypothetical protein
MEHFWNLLFQLMKPTLYMLHLYFCSVQIHVVDVKGILQFPLQWKYYTKAVVILAWKLWWGQKIERLQMHASKATPLNNTLIAL